MAGGGTEPVSERGWPRLRSRLELRLAAAFWIVAAVTAFLCGTRSAYLPYAVPVAVLAVLYVAASRSRWTPSPGVMRWVAGAVDWAPFALVVVTYDMLHEVSPRCWATTIDPYLAACDRAVFGTDLGHITSPHVSPAIAWALSACYAFYYVAPLSLGIWWWRRNRRAFRELMLGETGCLFIGYLGYLLLPAVGPHAHLPEFAAPIAGDWIGPLIRARNAGHGGHFPRDAFPSLHTANAVTLLIAAWRHERRVLYVYGLPMLGLIAATMLLRYHYAVDVLAGALLAAAFHPVAVRWGRT